MVGIQILEEKFWAVCQGDSCSHSFSMMQTGKVIEFSTYIALDGEGVLGQVAIVVGTLGYMEAGFGFRLEGKVVACW